MTRKMAHSQVWPGKLLAADLRQQVDAGKPHPTFTRVLAKIPPEIRRTFTPIQMGALAHALRPSPLHHAIDYRVSLPLFGRRFYFTMLLGRERRSLERLRKEGQLSRRTIPIALLLLACLFVGFGAAYLTILLYLMISA